MAITFSHRRYRDGDAPAINALYRHVTGIERSQDEFAWQWLNAPGGIAEMWLIEAHHPDGTTELIGHHGVMPIRFTWGDQDLLFGKTENTMVLQDYRRKILYPRFEQAFAAVYEPRFDALFSTTGPQEALRQRRAAKYDMSHQWVWLVHATPILGSIALIASQSTRLNRVAAPLLRIPSWRRGAQGIRFERLSPSEALREPFFETYWPHARATAGISPARFRDDLAWRFWKNPYHSPHVFITEGQHGRGFVVADLSKPGVARIMDWSFDDPSGTRHAFDALLYHLGSVCKSHLITFATTDDGLASDLAPLFRGPWITRVRKKKGAPMPRKITTLGASAGLVKSGWQVTPILFQGR